MRSGHFAAAGRAGVLETLDSVGEGLASQEKPAITQISTTIDTDPTLPRAVSQGSAWYAGPIQVTCCWEKTPQNQMIADTNQSTSRDISRLRKFRPGAMPEAFGVLFQACR